MNGHPPRLGLNVRALIASVAILIGIFSFPLPQPVHAQTGASSPPVRPPELTGTRQAEFDIPFTLQADQQGIVQVVLHVSRDQGRTWEAHSTRPPSAGQLPFRAPAEGEYWFGIQTVNRHGVRLPPDHQLRPGLRVVVDRQQPSLAFDVRPDAAGRIVSSIQASDPHINPSSLVIEYQSPGDGDRWKRVPTRSNRAAEAGVYFDELAWWPDSPGLQITVRATVRDVAGNAVSATRQLNLPANPAAQVRTVPTNNNSSLHSSPAPQTPSSIAGSAAAEPDSRIQTRYLKSRLPVALEHLYGTAPDETPAPARQAANPGEPAPSSSSPPLPDDQATRTGPQPPQASNRLARHDLTGSARGNGLVDSPAGTAWQSRPAGTANSSPQTAAGTTASWRPRSPAPSTSSRPAAAAPDPVRAAAGPVADQQETFQPVSHRVPGNRPATGNSSAVVWPATPVDSSPPLPAADGGTAAKENAAVNGGVNAVWSSSTTGAAEHSPPRPPAALTSGPQYETLRKMARHSRSRRFQLDYDVDAIGPEGVKQVELWMTSDGGNSWRRTTTDDDLRSPVDVETGAEGIFGFRIRVISNQGLSARPPQRGDPADMWVNVDTTMPRSSITAAPYGNGSEAGQLVIQWQASDDHLAVRPVCLKYGSSPRGPWTLIREGLRNSGEFAWKPDVKTPDQVWLRLEVRDQAGNVSVHMPDRPVDISGLIPRGHIRGLTPLVKPNQPPPATSGGQST